MRHAERMQTGMALAAIVFCLTAPLTHIHTHPTSAVATSPPAAADVGKGSGYPAPPLTTGSAHSDIHMASSANAHRESVVVWDSLVQRTHQMFQTWKSKIEIHHPVQK